MSAEARDGATGDGDEQEREQSAFPQRAGTVDVLRQRRHFQFRVEDHNSAPDRRSRRIFRKVARQSRGRGSAIPRKAARKQSAQPISEAYGGVFSQRRAPVRVTVAITPPK